MADSSAHFGASTFFSPKNDESDFGEEVVEKDAMSKVKKSWVARVAKLL